MKRISCLLLSLLLALLCACGDTNTPAPPDQTEPDGQETPSVPAVCSLYYDCAELELIAPTNSKLPLAAGASHGAPDYLPLWHNGEYGQLAASGGEGYMVADLTGGKAYEEGAYGRFCWNGELYHCVHLKADSCYVPSLCSTSGGILWLELSGDCWADTGWDETGHFGGFDTVVITGSGTLTLSQRLEAGTGKEKLPALVVDGVDVTCPEVGLVANSTAEDTANYVSALSNGWKFVGATRGLLVTNILDRRYIRFETEAVWWAQLIKLVVGFGLLLAIRSGLKAPLIALCGGAAEIAGGIRYLLIVLFAGCVWPLTFWGFSRLGRR